MKTKRKTRFINLAEQLAIQNDIVRATMESLLGEEPARYKVGERTDGHELTSQGQFTGSRSEVTPGSIVPKPKSRYRADSSTSIRVDD